MFDSEGIHQAIYIVAEHRVIFHCLILDPSNSALLLDSSRSRTRSYSSSCVRMCGCGTEDLPWETCGSVEASGSEVRLAIVLVVGIDGKFIRRFGNGNSFTVRNWTESRWCIRIHYCPPLFLRDASRNRLHNTEVAVSCVITWLPPNHRNSKRYRMYFRIQPLRKICCTFTAAYVRGPGFILVADLASEIKIIRPFTIAVIAFLYLANVTSPQM